MGNIETILNKVKDGELSVSEASSNILKIQNEKVDKVVEKRTAEQSKEFENKEQELKDQLSKVENELTEFKKETTKTQLEALNLNEEEKKVAQGILEKGVSVSELKKIMGIEDDVEKKVDEKIQQKTSKDEGKSEEGNSEDKPETKEETDIDENVLKHLDEI